MTGTDEYVCCICADLIVLDHRPYSMVWSDPHGTGCIAHRTCLSRLGEFELGLEDTPW